MQRHSHRRSIAATAVGVASMAGLFVACAKEAEQPQAAPSTTAVTTTTTVTTKPSTSVPTSSQRTTTTASSVSLTAIRSIDVETYFPYGLDKVGPELWEMDPTSSSDNYLSFRWRSKGENGDVESDECTVVADITGPAGFDERRRSGQCTGSVDGKLTINTPGVYTISIAITPPDAQAPVTATHTFEVINEGT